MARQAGLNRLEWGYKVNKAAFEARSFVHHLDGDDHPFVSVGGDPTPTKMTITKRTSERLGFPPGLLVHDGSPNADIRNPVCMTTPNHASERIQFDAVLSPGSAMERAAVQVAM